MTTLITGASSGIGETLALESSARGEELFICGRNLERLRAVAEKCKGPCIYEVIDVSDREAVEDWMTRIHAAHPIDRVFANAGVSTGEETSANARRTFEINVMGTVNTVLPAIDLGIGQIVITASIAGYGPLKACPSYSASKACLKTWGLALRGALAPRGIKVNVICPGFVRSRITDKNTCPMPFFMEADKAARIILKGVDKNRGLIAFPAPLRFATYLISILPYRLNELINKLLPKKA